MDGTVRINPQLTILHHAEGGAGPSFWPRYSVTPPATRSALDLAPPKNPAAYRILFAISLEKDELNE
jgi:hypothetical protein